MLQEKTKEQVSSSLKVVEDATGILKHYMENFIEEMSEDREYDILRNEEITLEEVVMLETMVIDFSEKWDKFINKYQDLFNKERPNCYKCKYRKALPDGHSSCSNPRAQAVGELYAMRKGWFMHPYNYLPECLVSCTGFLKTELAKEKERNEVCK